MFDAELLKDRILSRFSRVISRYISHCNIILSMRSEIFQLVVFFSFSTYLWDRHPVVMKTDKVKGESCQSQRVLWYSIV